VPKPRKLLCYQWSWSRRRTVASLLRGKRTAPEGKVETTTMDNPKNMITEEFMNEADMSKLPILTGKPADYPQLPAGLIGSSERDTRKVAVHSSKHRAALLECPAGF